MQQTFVGARLMCINQTTNLMKKILSVVLVLIVIGQVNAMEVEPKSPQGISIIKKGELVKLFYRGEQSGKVKVTILNEDGDVVFTETMQDTEQFMRPYNFKSLPYGEYTIELSDESGKRYKKVSHNFVKPSRAAHLTRLNQDENRYMLAVPNKGTDALTVRIYDERDQMLFEETETIHGDFAKVYNLNTVAAGEHTFEIVDEDGKRNRLTK